MDNRNVSNTRRNSNASIASFRPVIFITDEASKAARKYNVGGKARNLFRMKEMGLNVPAFGVIPQEVLSGMVLKNIQGRSNSEAIDLINTFEMPSTFIQTILSHFPKDTFFAVRSSAIDEDGNDFSFAGQFESYLYVTKNDLVKYIKKVWCSAFSERVNLYRAMNNLEEHFGISVVIQQMVPAEVSGVAFGINPTNGDRKAKVISAVYGLGEGLVSGDLDADHFVLKDDFVKSQLAEKTHQVLFDAATGNGTITKPVDDNNKNTTTLTEAQIKEIAKILDLGFEEYGKAQDIEFAIYNDEIFLLQTRPITNLQHLPNENGEYILWDNSNIIESYPGVTTPLTFSFISESYEGAYKLFSEYMGVSPKVIKENERVFANTLGLINGRVYYNLKTWYHMLAMLPGYSINARFMEKMMGVKERFDVQESYRLSKGTARWNIAKMGMKMLWNFFSLPKKRKAFKKLLEETISKYKEINYASKNANELMQLYLNFEKTLLQEWKAPLLNDFFAMIWFGLLQKRCAQFVETENPNIHNDLLCGSSDIISTQPVHRSIALATMISEKEDLKNLFLSNNEKEIWKILSVSKETALTNLKKEIDQYLNDFGERCIGELKLETISYNQDPTKFIKTIKAYVETGITANTMSSDVEEKLRKNAEAEVAKSLKNKFFKRYQLNQTIRYTRALVSARENLRYERTRAFGIVRTIFTAIGKQFFSENIISDPRDIFYLKKEEIFSFIEGTSVSQNLKGLIALRKEEFSKYEEQEIPSERFATYGAVYHANDFFSTNKLEKLDGDIKGIGCCPGRVRGKVQVIHDPSEVTSLNGNILVTSSTDPGWVTLFPSASAIIVERGSLLSHSAIVSREMGIPCIVSVTGLLKRLKTGDEIEMDGSTGEIKLILGQKKGR